MEKPLRVQSGYKPTERKSFRKPEPMLEEAARRLSEQEAIGVFHSASRKSGEVMYQRFQEAKDMLASLYDAEISLVKRPNEGIRLMARLEFPTSHRTLDEDLDQLVRSAGFLLSLRIMPVQGLPMRDAYEAIPGRFIEETMHLPAGDGGPGGVWMRKEPVMVPRTDRRYVITENPYMCSDLRHAADRAEGLLVLASRLMPASLPEEPPAEKRADVVPITSARSSRAPPRASDEPPAPLVGARAS